MGGFEQTTVKSFHAVKADMDEFKRSMNEWIIFLDGSLREAKQRIMELERKIAELEDRQDTFWR
ncbi:hypothetical protein HYY73_02690 [Candidatus Woesearchaeota archaeon]|nr:hypothetical protein [Candidatus Woesearchaeota archaeon]